MLPDAAVDGGSDVKLPRTLGRAYLEGAGECEKAISHHFRRRRRPEELIGLVPELDLEIAAVMGGTAVERG